MPKLLDVVSLLMQLQLILRQAQLGTSLTLEIPVISVLMLLYVLFKIFPVSIEMPTVQASVLTFGVFLLYMF